MRNIILLAALVAAILVFYEVECQRNASPTIPQHLLPCYRNPEIYTREYRLTSKFRTFIDLVKKIERSPGGRFKNAKDTAMALLYHLRLDGIQLTPNVKQTQDVTPFAPSGDNYFKYRLTLIGLLPKPSRPSNFDLLNDTLTQYEMCNLHFMLSYSIDPYRREDEDCGKIKFEESGQYRYDSGYGYNLYRSQSYRHKRESAMEKRLLDMRIESLKRSLDHLKRRRALLRHKRSVIDREENLRSPDVEILPPSILEAHKAKETKSDFTLAGHEFLGPKHDHVLRGGLGLGAPPSRTNEGNLYKRTAMYYGDENRVLIPNQPMSKCPIENGVIKHKYGGITIGAVVAGIAAGFNYQRIPLSEFGTELKGPLSQERVNNIWATTLAGNAADLILSLGHFDTYRDGVGLRGGWDSLQKPKYYMLEKEAKARLTDVELRGALDGLWLGQTIEKFNKRLAIFTLSDILEMYYSENGFLLDPKVKASKRGDEVTAYAPTDEFKKQTHLLAAVMENQRLSTVTYSGFEAAVEATVAAINSYIPTLSPKHLIDLSGSPVARSQIDQRADLVIVIDPSWGLPSLEYYIGELIEEELGATQGQSNLTIICPYDDAIYPIVNSVDFETQFKRIYEDCKRRGEGITYEVVFELVLKHFADAVSEEHRNRRINPYSFVTVFMLSNSQVAPGSETAERELERLEHYIPGIDILVVTDGPKEKFRDLVKSTDKDAFSLPIVAQHDHENNNNNADLSRLFDRIANIPRRISNPAWGSRFGNGTIYEGDSELKDDVRLGRTAVYKIHPSYLWDSTDVKITLRTRGHTVTVCQARDALMLPPQMQRGYRNSIFRGYNTQDPYPETENGFPYNNNGGENSNGDNRCKKGSNVVFDFENLCEGADSIEDCKPLFLSVQAPLEAKLELKCVDCRHPTNVEYEMKISGLTNNGAGALFASMSLLIISYIITILWCNLY